MHLAIWVNPVARPYRFDIDVTAVPGPFTHVSEPTFSKLEPSNNINSWKI